MRIREKGNKAVVNTQNSGFSRVILRQKEGCNLGLCLSDNPAEEKRDMGCCLIPLPNAL